MVTIGAVGAFVAGGAAPGLAATASGVRYEAVQGTYLDGTGGECDALVLSAAVSTGAPAYVSVAVLNGLKGSCTGWVERSVNKGAWKNVSAKETAAGGGSGWFKTANYYAGPGNRVRGCIQVGKKVSCSPTVTLAKSSAKPANDAVAPGYEKKAADLSSSSAGCAAALSGSTKSKAKTSRANLVVLSFDYACNGWLEVSTDKGKTWTQATQTYSLSATTLTELAFSPSVADGAGRLVRACLQQGTAAKHCSASW